MQICDFLLKIIFYDGKGELITLPSHVIRKIQFIYHSMIFSKLLVKLIHFKVLHNGVKDMLNELRTRFWISKARKFISSVIKNCFICKKVEGPAYKYPPDPDLPSTRVAFTPAFTHTGVDYAGPVFVKSIYNSQNMYKAWTFIFTCASSRAICLELVPSCDAGKCINALRRFFSRYGVPETILSDNGTQFLSQETQSFISSYGLK